MHHTHKTGKSIIQALVVKCANANNECEWKGSVYSLDEHILTCSFLNVDASPNTPSRQSSEADVRCYVFVDYSNLWVAGQKQHGKKLVDTDIDHRFRVDLEKFLHQVTSDRHLSKAFLYGATPQIIRVAAREKGFKIKAYEGLEANVAMARDILLTLHGFLHTENKDNMVFIIVTGDRKFRPLIEETLHNGVPVELWSWEDAMSQEYRQLAHAHENFTAKYLGEEFSFTAYMSTRDKKDIDPAHAIVYRDVPADDSFLQTQLIESIRQLRRLFYMTNIETQIEGRRDVIIEFPQSNPEDVFVEIRKLSNLSDYQPCSYPEYKTGTKKLNQPIPTRNRFKSLGKFPSLDVEDSAVTEEPPDEHSSAEGQFMTSQDDLEESDAKSNSPWKTELRRQPGKMTHMNKRKEMCCTRGDHCPKAFECPYQHTEDERKLFERHRYTSFQYFKTAACKKRDQHMTPELKKWCFYAHDDDDSWCLNCHTYGHLTNNCPMK